MHRSILVEGLVQADAVISHVTLVQVTIQISVHVLFKTDLFYIFLSI